MATQVKEYGLQIDNDALKAQSYFPGVAYDDFDRGGGVSPWKICRMFEAGRAIPFFLGNFIQFQDIATGQYRFFVLGGDYYFDSCLWEVTRKYHYFPYQVSMDVIGVGQSSLTYRQVLVNTLDKKEVASHYGKVVYVDTETRRPQELPYWYRQKYRKADSNERIRVDAYDYNAPSTAHKLRSVVVASDTDENGHTNQASYIRFCMDAAASAAKENVLTRLKHDICLYPILKMTSSYRSETMMGDEVVTSVWEDDLSPLILYFTVHVGDKLAFTSTMKFKNTACPKL